MKKRYFCTYFDINYLSRGMALYESICKHCDSFELFILAIDTSVEKYFNNSIIDNVKIISIDEYLKFFNVDRGKFSNEKQFYFSITPNLCLYVLQNFRDIDILAYLDSDIYFFNSVEYLFKEVDNHSIGICSHRNNKILYLFANHYGYYNVGINVFRNNEMGLKCLNDWKYECDNWQPDDPTNRLPFFSDQIYLDDWPKKFDDLKIINHIGINAAPWNAINYRWSFFNETFYLNKHVPLIAFHFSSLKRLSQFEWNADCAKCALSLGSVLKDLYKIYITNILKYDTQNYNYVQLKYKRNLKQKLIRSILNSICNENILVYPEGVGQVSTIQSQL